MVRDYDIPGDYALNKESVEAFVLWSNKPDSQLVQKKEWFVSHSNTYKNFGPYWLELAKDYYNLKDYQQCLTSIREYETVSTRIVRKDIDYAKIIPLAILSAKETMKDKDYIEFADRYCSAILANTKDTDWSLHYFAAQIYLDLYSLTKNKSYLDKAYKIAFDNIIILVDEQKELNKKYLSKVEEVKADQDATKREIEEIKKYNELIKKERKTALPPVNEALYLNCDLLFALAEKREISEEERDKIDAILHENRERIFLTESLDNRFWFKDRFAVIKDMLQNNSDTVFLAKLLNNVEKLKDASSEIYSNHFETTYEHKELSLPASCVTDRSRVNVTVSGPSGTTIFDDWEVLEVIRPKNSNDCSQFTVKYQSKEARDYKYQAGETVTIKVTPIEDKPDEYIEFTYNTVAVKNYFLFDGVAFEREEK